MKSRLLLLLRYFNSTEYTHLCNSPQRRIGLQKQEAVVTLYLTIVISGVSE